MPEVTQSVPTATLTGWNLFRSPFGDGDHEADVEALREHAQQLVADRLLLPEDARASVRRATAPLRG